MDFPSVNPLQPGDLRRKRRRRLPWVLAGTFLCGALVGGLAVGCIVPRPSTAWRPTGDNRPQTLLASPSFHALPAVKEAARQPLTPQDMEFGELQVRRMVQDRPAMRQSVNPGDPIWRYCARAFGGGATGTHVFWNPDAPGDDFIGDHQWPFEKDPGYIRLRREYASGPSRGQPVPCEELWSAAVFELENIRNGPAFQDLWREAVYGQMSRAVWIRENTRLEFHAVRRTVKLYHSLWEAPAAERGIAATPSLWYAGAPATYEEWISQYDDPQGYPWSFWGRYYDEQLAPRGLHG